MQSGIQNFGRIVAVVRAWVNGNRPVNWRRGNGKVGKNRDVQRDKRQHIPDSRVGRTGDENPRVLGVP